MKKQAKIIAMIKNKGGTGATSLIHSIAGELSLRGKKILLIDTDQQNNLKTLFKINTDATNKGLASILLEGVQPSAVVVSVRENIDLLTSGARHIREVEEFYNQTPHAEFLLKTRMSSVADKYDYILIDVAPSITLLTSMIICYANYLITPTTCDLLGLVGTKTTISFVELAQANFGKSNIGKMLAIIPSLVDTRRRVDTDLLEDLHRLEETNLTNGAIITSPFRTDSKIRTSQVRRKLIQESFNNSKAADDIRLITNELEVAIEKLETKTPKNKPKAASTEIEL